MEEALLKYGELCRKGSDAVVKYLEKQIPSVVEDLKAFLEFLSKGGDRDLAVRFYRNVLIYAVLRDARRVSDVSDTVILLMALYSALKDEPPLKYIV